MILAIVLLITAASNAASFWQLTDVHWDWEYKVGTIGAPSKDGDCHTGVGNAGPFGDYYCDPPYSLVNGLLKEMFAIQPTPDFFLWTGDIIPHSSDGKTKQEFLDCIANFTSSIRQHFPATRVFPVLGNHDVGFAQGQIAPGEYWLTDEVGTMWADWLSPAALATFKHGGYYTESVSSKLRIVCVNTVYYYSVNKLVTPGSDPSGQLAWLNSTLSDAERHGETVLLIGHIAPGLNERTGGDVFSEEFNTMFLDALEPFLDTVPIQLYGHLHSDTFRIIRDSKGVPRSMALLAPAVDPWYNFFSTAGWENANNPGVRLFNYDAETGTVLDYVQYYSDISKDTASGAAQWNVEYAARQEYGLSSLAAGEWAALAARMRSDDDVFARYYRNNGVAIVGGAPPGQKDCDAGCKTTQICALEQARYDQFRACKSKRQK